MNHILVSTKKEILVCNLDAGPNHFVEDEIKGEAYISFSVQSVTPGDSDYVCLERMFLSGDFLSKIQIFNMRNKEWKTLLISDRSVGVESLNGNTIKMRHFTKNEYYGGLNLSLLPKESVFTVPSFSAKHKRKNICVMYVKGNHLIYSQEDDVYYQWGKLQPQLIFKGEDIECRKFCSYGEDSVLAHVVEDEKLTIHLISKCGVNKWKEYIDPSLKSGNPGIVLHDGSFVFVDGNDIICIDSSLSRKKTWRLEGEIDDLIQISSPQEEINHYEKILKLHFPTVLVKLVLKCLLLIK